ncbi:MAG: CPBP family intramembrane metalloprotease [Candidatus Lokiarchaeota archaeon]|nr:CPBP family intramembrane metalloprotease [Candidatus Lokiarchaeota archaeon]
MYSKLNAQERIIKERGRYLLEVILIFGGILIFNLIPYLLLPILINKDSIYYGPIFFLLRATGIFIAIPLFLFIINKVLGLEKQKIIINQEEINPAISHLKLYKISKNNFKYQLLYGLLILFLVFIPLDFIFYWLIPDTIEYSVEALGESPKLNAYLSNNNYIIFLISVIIIHISVSFYEETLTRGFLAKRGNDYFQRMSAVIISSLYFGLGHFTYIFKVVSWIPLIWFIQTFIVGIILGLFFLRKKWMFPIIFAHAFNNIISAHTLWNYTNGYNFSDIALYLYAPLLIIGLILVIVQFSRIKAGIMTGMKDFRSYFKNNKKIKENNKDKYVRILIDLIITLLIFGISLIIVV